LGRVIVFNADGAPEVPDVLTIDTEGHGAFVLSTSDTN
jgi:hypothetical protein